MNKKSRDKLQHELSCGCGHCGEVESKTINIQNAGFFKENFNFLIKLFFSSLLWCLGSFLKITNEAKLTFFVASSIIIGNEVVFSLLKNVLKLKIFDENSLMIIATVCAFILGEYAEGAIIIILFIFGEWLEGVATDNSRKKIAGLAELRAETVCLMTKSGIEDVSPSEVPIGSFIQVKRGDIIPIDGILLDKYAVIDMKAITGESRYFEAKAGYKIFSGSVNVGDAIVLKTEKKYTDSTAQRIISTVENSLSAKANTQKFITKFSRFYTPIVVGVGVILATVPPLFQGFNFSFWVYKALAFIVISCPCALVISIPLSFFAGIGGLAKKGVLVKGSKYLETLSKVNAVAFDKTGTITTGAFTVNKVEYYDNFNKEIILGYAKSIENFSNHPLAKAVCSFAKEANRYEVENVSEITGRGMSGIINGEEILIGNYNFHFERGVSFNSPNSTETLIFLAVNGVLACVFYLSDTIKNEAKSAIENIIRLGINENYLVSGDKVDVVESLAKKLNLTKYYGNLLPEQKFKIVDEIKNNKKTLLFAGDGVNDAPVLSLSDVGVAMGGLGSGIAIETADVVIMDDDLRKIPLTIRHSRKVKKIILENIVGSLAVKIVIMALSVCLTIPIWLVMFSDVGVMLLALFNSTRCAKIP